MSFLEFVGFIVTMLAMAYLMIRQVRKAGQEPAQEKEISPEQRKKMNELLRALDIEVEDEEEEPQEVPQKKKPVLPPSPSVAARYVQKRVSLPLTELSIRGAGTDDSYAISSEFVVLSLPSVIPLDSDPIPRTSHVKALLKNLPSNKELLIFHDVFGPPKGI